MLEHIEGAAMLSVTRGCGFAALAVFCVMFGLSFDFALSFKVGGVLMLATCLILVLKGWHAPVRPYKRTETWIILPVDKRPTAATAQKLIGNVLRAVYLRFAIWTAAIAVLFLGIAVFVMVFVPGSGLN
ncbi:MAG: hypothetical protein VX871_10840, partial [Pseudomonadota bacterium]|nr:hypothetical protein [Pseudomonadota bacterium]